LCFGAWRPGDQLWYVSDIRAISSAIGWRPQVVLRDGLSTLDRWLTDRFAAPAQRAEREVA
jgi:CDP-paratose 2-epimerase